MQICKNKTRIKWNYHTLFALSCISIKMSSKKKQPKVKQIAAGRTLLNHNHFNQKTYINVINHAQNYNVELDYQYKQHTLTHSIMQPETVNGNAIRACDFKIRSRNELWPFLNLPSHRSIRAASKRCGLILEAPVEECRLRLRTDPERALVSIVQT